MGNKKGQEYLQNVNQLEKHEAAGDIRVLLFGSSIVKHLRHKEIKREVWDSYLKPLKAFNLGVSGDRAYETIDRISDVHIERKYHKNLKAVLIHVGSNDAANCSSPSCVAETVIRCACYITLRNPHLTIIISSVLPRRNPKPNKKFGGNENTVMASINASLHNYCRRCHFVFMENWVDETEQSLYRKDGVHLTLKGNQRFAAKIRDTISALPTSTHADPISAVTVDSITHTIVNIATSRDPRGMNRHLYDYAKCHAKYARYIFHSAAGSASLVPSIDASAHASHASNFIAAAVDVDVCLAFRALSVSDFISKPSSDSLRKTIDNLSSDDTDTEPEWTDRVKKKRLKKRGHQDKKR